MPDSWCSLSPSLYYSCAVHRLEKSAKQRDYLLNNLLVQYCTVIVLFTQLTSDYQCSELNSVIIAGGKIIADHKHGCSNKGKQVKIRPHRKKLGLWNVKFCNLSDIITEARSSLRKKSDTVDNYIPSCSNVMFWRLWVKAFDLSHS